jgi:hypothetical protein
MAYEFTQWEQEPEPQASSGRSGGPPRKSPGIGVLDPPFPPKKPVGPIPRAPASRWSRILGGVILVVLVAAIFLLLFSNR